MALGLLGGATALAPADCRVRLGQAGQEITELYPWLTEVIVACSRNQAWTGRLQFESAPDAGGAWPVQDHPSVVAWAKAKVEATFGPVTETVLTGYVREVKAEYPADPGRSSVTVELQDASLALDREHKRRRWPPAGEQADDSLILPAVLAEHGLTPQPDNGSGRQGPVVNQDGTDVKLLRARADDNAYELMFEPEGVYFGPPRMKGAPQPGLAVYRGSSSNCIAFAGDVDAHAPDAVAIDVPGATQPEIVKPDLPPLGARPATTAAVGLPPFVWRLGREGGDDPAELRRKALQKANAQSLRVHAEGELDGALYGRVLRVGRLVTVTGVGDTFGGTWYVDTVSHRFSADGYRQAFTLVRNQVGDDASGAGGLLAGVL